MFKKVLIAEDHGITGSGLEQQLVKLSIPEVEIVHYCDDALLKIKAGLRKEQPFELLLTDLSFEKDHRNCQLKSGEELIAEAKKIQPEIKVVVYSVEYRIEKIKNLFDTYHIDGFVGKERKDFNAIKEAVASVFEGNTYTSYELQQLLRSKENILELDDYDILILKLLAKGLKQEEISIYFQGKNYPASSLRSIQDRLSNLKLLFEAKTPIHLVAQAIEKGFI